jgi:hypothetical protein
MGEEPKMPQICGSGNGDFRPFVALAQWHYKL